MEANEYVRAKQLSEKAVLRLVGSTIPEEIISANIDLTVKGLPVLTVAWHPNADQVERLFGAVS